MPRSSRLFVPGALLACLVAVPAAADLLIARPGDDLPSIIGSMQPGDELQIESGTYTLSSGLKIDLFADSQSPSLIRAADGADVLIDLPSAAHNLVEIRNSQYLTVRGIAFKGGSHGIRLMSSSFITIEDCEVFDTADVAISANAGGTYDGLVIRNNHIHHTNGTGEGMYLGCNNDACRVANSLIEGNYVHHTNQPGVEQGDGIELKEGSFGNTIRDNVIHDTNYPGILTYSTVGNGAPNVIEGNIIWNTNDYGIQSAADATIRNNILLGESIGLQQHQSGSPSNIVLVHNTIVTGDSGIYVRNVVGPVTIANNAVYSQSGPAIRLISGDIGQVTVAGNVGAGGVSGASTGFVTGGGVGSDFVDAGYGRVPPIDVFPAPGSALENAASPAHVTAIDFNGTPRNGAAHVGAYHFDAGGNPGWALTADFKNAGAQSQTPMPPENLRAD